MNTVRSLPTIALRCTEGGHHKEYHLSIRPQGEGYQLHYAFGAIGSTLRPGIHKDTETPVPFARAVELYERRLQEQLGKGYRPVGVAAPAAASYTSPAGNKREEGAIPVMLCDTAEYPHRFIGDDRWLAQPKWDGHRGLLRITADARVFVQNRKGLVRGGFPTPWAAEMKRLAFARGCAVDSTGEITLDGEMIGERFVAFDLIHIDGRDVRDLPCVDRLALLEDLFEDFTSEHLSLTPTAHSTEEKKKLLHRIEMQEGEGLIFKKVSAPYVGRRTDQQMKYKLWKTATALVIAHNDTGEVLNGGGAIPVDKVKRVREKSSVQIAMLEGGIRSQGVLVNVGDVTIHRQKPELGAFVEVKYLYAHPESRKLYHTQILQVRDDVTLDDCNIKQLRYKQEVA